jgi:transposase
VPELRYLTRFPWARKDSGFTLLFEALVMTLDTSMPVGAAARRRGWRANTTPRVIHHYVEEARGRADASDVTRLAIDETRRSHDYITLFVKYRRSPGRSRH